MNYAVIDTGKTGHVISNSLPQDDLIAICNENPPVIKEKIRKPLWEPLSFPASSCAVIGALA